MPSMPLRKTSIDLPAIQMQLRQPKEAVQVKAKGDEAIKTEDKLQIAVTMTIQSNHTDTSPDEILVSDTESLK